MAKKKKFNRDYVYETITERIAGYIEKNKVLPWRRPWASLGDEFAPQNFKSKKPYQGINRFLCLMSEFESPYFLTIKQANELGGRIIKGSRSTPIVLWQPPSEERKNKILLDSTLSEEQKEDRIDRLFGFYKLYWVFNSEQIEGIEFPKIEPPKTKKFNPIKKAEKVVKDMPKAPKITHKGDRAFYDKIGDRVNMPVGFDNPEDYYSTLFHELAHSTGHHSRLDRFKDDKRVAFGSKKYGFEELVAELSSSFIMNELRIENKATEVNSVAYINSWLKTIKANPRMLMQAMNKAIPATNFIFGRI